jgi:hypothetical protein
VCLCGFGSCFGMSLCSAKVAPVAVLPGFAAQSCGVACLNRGTPRDVITRINADVSRLIEADDFRKTFLPQQMMHSLPRRPTRSRKSWRRDVLAEEGRVHRGEEKHFQAATKF